MKLIAAAFAVLAVSLTACGSNAAAGHKPAARHHTVYVLYEESVHCQITNVRPHGIVRLLDEHGTLLGTGRLDGGGDGTRGCEYRTSIAGVPVSSQYVLKGAGVLGTQYRSKAEMVRNRWDWDIRLQG